jgi:CubicO group peptidase (beta-lactamase class C family)
VAAPETQGVDPRRLEAGLLELSQVDALRSLLVARNGVLVSENYFRGADSATGFAVKSVSKSILSAATGVAIARGALKGLDQPIATILPEYFPPRLRGPGVSDRVLGVRAQADSLRRLITVRDLLTMEAGFSWLENGPEASISTAWELSSDWIRFVTELPFTAPPGQRFTYNTAATHLLSAVLGRATGMGTRRFAERYLLHPAGITVAGWDKDPRGIDFGGSEVYLTARGMVRFGLLYLNHGAWGNRSIVPEPWVRASTAPQASFDSTARAHTRADITGYGYLWWLRDAAGHPSWLAWGYGGQSITVIPDLGLVVTATGDLASRAGARVNDAVFQFIDRSLIPAITR